MKFIKSPFIFLLSLFIALAALEIYLSKAEIVSKSPNSYLNDYGRARKPNTKYLNFNEGFGLGQFNQFGYLGPGYPPEKQDGTLRIALLGDSYVEGFQVFDRHHFRFLLEKQLTDKLKQKVEVMNFGRSGFNLADVYAYAQIFASRFKPDLYLYFLSNEDLTSRQTDRLLPKVTINPDSSLSIHIPDDEKRIALYKSQLSYMNQSALAMLTRNVINQTKNPALIMNKLFDKLYSTPKGQLYGSSQTTAIDPVNLTVLNNLNTKKELIISIAREEPNIPEQFNSLVIVRLHEVLTKNGQYDESYHYWKGSGKSGHWNQEAHHVIANIIASNVFQGSIQRYSDQ
jgi:hypothetical protein